MGRWVGWVGGAEGLDKERVYCSLITISHGRVFTAECVFTLSGAFVNQ